MSTLSVLRDFPETVTRIARLFQDPLLTDSGSLTSTRDYSTCKTRLVSFLNSSPVLQMHLA